VNYFEKTLGKTLVPRFYNRLDMNTSGLIIIAKNAYTQAFLQDKTEVKKTYKVIASGIIEKDDFFISCIKKWDHNRFSIFANTIKKSHCLSYFQ